MASLGSFDLTMIELIMSKEMENALEAFTEVKVQAGEKDLNDVYSLYM